MQYLDTALINLQNRISLLTDFDLTEIKAGDAGGGSLSEVVNGVKTVGQDVYSLLMWVGGFGCVILLILAAISFDVIVFAAILSAVIVPVAISFDVIVPASNLSAVIVPVDILPPCIVVLPAVDKSEKLTLPVTSIPSTVCFISVYLPFKSVATDWI